MIKKINILGVEYTIAREDMNRRAENAMVEYYNQTITIDSRISDDEFFHLLIHEIMHVIFYMTTSRRLPEAEEEQLVTSAGVGMFNVLIDNPILCSVIVRKRARVHGKKS